MAYLNILQQRKCRDAVIVWDGIIVDGHNRFEICAKHGVAFEIKEMSFVSRDEAMLWILDNQLGRRNLSDAARIELAIAKTELLRKKGKDNQIAAGLANSRDAKLSTKRDNREAADIVISAAACQGLCVL